MRLATVRDGNRDGQLVVVGPRGDRYLVASGITPTLQSALDDWDALFPQLRELSQAWDRDPEAGEPLEHDRLLAPLPRAYEWIDASAYINHILLVRKARGAAPPPTLETEPLVYQGGSGVLLGPREEIPLADESWGLDFEGELGVILGDTPQGCSAETALGRVRLLVLINDLTLRELVPHELAKGFGFFQSKPATAFSPFAITPDELGPQFREGRVHGRLRCELNGELVGDPEAGPEMHFSFDRLIEHVTRTRSLTAGTILGSGTVSNADPQRGVSCLAEQRMREILQEGKPRTPYLRVGDRVRLEMLDAQGRSLFGCIEQSVVSP